MCLQLIDACGLRLTEGTQRQVSDIDTLRPNPESLFMPSVRSGAPSMTGLPIGSRWHYDVMTPHYAACLRALVNRVALEATRMSHPCCPTPVGVPQLDTGPLGPHLD